MSDKTLTPMETPTPEEKQRSIVNEALELLMYSPDRHLGLVDLLRLARSLREELAACKAENERLELEENHLNESIAWLGNDVEELREKVEAWRVDTGSIRSDEDYWRGVKDGRYNSVKFFTELLKQA